MAVSRLPQPLPREIAELVPGFSVLDPKDAPPLRWGIIGAGGIARVFASDVPAYSSQQVVAIGSRSLERAEEFAADFPGVRAYGSYEELVNADEVDIVYVATPHIRHRDDALLALNAGKPVLVEKAFTMTVAEAEEVFELAKEKNLFVMEAMWSRHLPHYGLLRALVDAGVGGNAVAVHADHGQSLRHVPRLMQADLGGGSTHDLGVYSAHFAQFVLGRPDQLTCVTRKTDTGVNAAEMIIGRYPDALSVASSNLDGLSATAGSVTFEKLSFEVPSQFYRPAEVVVRTFPKDADPLYGVEHHWDARVPGGFQYQAAAAARCISAGLIECPAVPWSSTLDVLWALQEAANS